MIEKFIFYDFLISPLDNKQIKCFNQHYLKSHGLTWKEFQKLYPGFPYQCDALKEQRLKKASSSKSRKKAIKTRYQHIKDAYYLSPKQCKNCQVFIVYEKRNQKFCSNSCRASYNNRHKKHGCNRSKFEI